MNWHAIRDKLLTEAESAYQFSRTALPGDDAKVEIKILCLVQASIASNRGDLLMSLAKAIDEGLKQ